MDKITEALNAIEYDDVIKTAVRLSERRDFLCKNAPICPKCETKQVQLVSWIHEDCAAKWKCRKCKEAWEFEPNKKEA